MLLQYRLLRAEFDRLARRLRKTKDWGEKDKLLADMIQICGTARQSILNPPIHYLPAIRWEKYRRVWS